MSHSLNGTELPALLRLLDDPDESVYEPVYKRILAYGTEVIPHLEHLWETTEQTEQQSRVESIIRRIQFQEILQTFDSWRVQDSAELWEGLLILDRLQSREDRSDTLRDLLGQLRRNAWLELNQYLTPLEQINVLSRVLFEHERFQGIDSARERLEHHFVGDILINRSGNQIGLGLLILALSEKLDLPLQALSVPGIFILGSPNVMRSRDKKGIDRIDFFLDPQTGELFGRAEIETYLRRIHQPIEESFFQPMTAYEVLRTWLGRVGQKAGELEDLHLSAQITELLQR